MPASEGPENQIRPLDQHHDRAAFSCGDERLDTYLRQNARNSMERGLAIVWVWTRPPSQQVIGYYTLTSTEVDAGILPVQLQKKLRTGRIGATLLGRFAIHSEFQGQGLGKMLCMRALRDALRVSKTVASVGVFLEARSEQAKAFWTKREFIPLAENEQGVRRFFMEMAYIEKLP